MLVRYRNSAMKHRGASIMIKELGLKTLCKIDGLVLNDIKE